MQALSSEEELLSRCQSIQGLSFGQLATSLNLSIPTQPLKRKGWVGQAIELALGATAGSKSEPDFQSLGIELKTLPLSSHGKPTESTFVTTIPLLTIHKQTWLTSSCYAKLKRVLWLPIEGDTQIEFRHRRIGAGLLWSPSQLEETILCQDWTELTTMIITGKLAELDARSGEYLQVRPKAANALSLCEAFDSEGLRVLTLPRGFYLRSSFTGTLI